MPIRILSGVQASGKLHLGNYFGAIKQHIELQQSAGFGAHNVQGRARVG